MEKEEINKVIKSISKDIRKICTVNSIESLRNYYDFINYRINKIYSNRLKELKNKEGRN